VVCRKRISETSAVEDTVYKVFQCVSSSTSYIDRIKFVKTVLNEVNRITNIKESPEIVVIKADWGVGKSTFLNIIQEFVKNKKINYKKFEFLELLRKSIDIRDFKDGVYLIDEVESVVDDIVKEEFKDRIIEFWLGLKELSNSKGNSIIYLSMTPSAYYKIFGLGGLLQTLFTETYLAFKERIRVIDIEVPTKLEFLLIINCLMKYNDMSDIRFLKYLDLPYFVTKLDRRRYIRLFNDGICKTYPSILEFFNEIARGKLDLNDENENVRIDELIRLEERLNSESEKLKLYSAILSRIVSKSEIPNIIEKDFVRGKLIPYSEWLVLSKEYDIDQRVEDFILTIDCDVEEKLDSCLKVFISDEIKQVLPELTEYEAYEQKFKKIYEIIEGKEAYALRWSMFSKLVNTNAEENIFDFKDKNLINKINKIVNEYLLRIDKELESLFLFIKYITKKEIKSSKYTNSSIDIRIDKFRIIIADITSKNELEELIRQISSDSEIIDGLILINNDFINSNIELVNNLSKLSNELSISLKILNIPIMKRRQLLYFIFYEYYKDKIVIKENKVENLLGKVREEIIKFLEDVEKKRKIIDLPLLKGGKRVDSSINWILYYPGLNIVTIDDLFNKVNEIVNSKFRIYGSKQFRLEDFETEKVLKEEIVSYFSRNGIIKYYNGLLDFQDLLGEEFKNFAKNLAGFLKQLYKSNLSKVLFNYVLYISGISQERNSKTLETVIERLYSRSATTEFLFYLAIASGELVKVLNDLELIEKLREYVEEARKNLDYYNEDMGVFLTVKKRDIGLRSVREMKEVLLTYKSLIDEAYKLRDFQNFVRLTIVFLYLYNLYVEQVSKTEESIVEINNIKLNINKKISELSEIKRFLNITEELDEEKKLRELLSKIDGYRDVESIKKVFASLDPEDFKSKVIDKVLDNAENNNLFLIFYKLLEKVLNGERINLPRELNGTLFEEISGFAEAGYKISQVISIYNEIKLNNPKIKELFSNIELKKKKINELIENIKMKVSQFEY